MTAATRRAPRALGGGGRGSGCPGRRGEEARGASPGPGPGRHARRAGPRTAQGARPASRVPAARSPERTRGSSGQACRPRSAAPSVRASLR